ncbi:hypothetical protein EUX98_g7021 [Antrodiella citrinella]|uniref:BTB domain-containing protein n=1 Tax=Antrodiella citrinella TaxID=2447956 RepID=A0A4S4MND8_9APHY|nr:hypothetical protein EUX98_g7021 [Antrodiella citrinella]
MSVTVDPDHTSKSAVAPTVAEAPFNNPKYADIILRTSNNVDFMVLKSILCQASPVFETTFSLPQGDTIDSESLLPVVAVTEDDKVIDTILRICYPVPNPQLDPIILTATLETGRKYEMSAVTQHGSDSLKALVDEEPVHAYSIACMFRFKDQALAAAKSSLRFPIVEILAQSHHLDHLTGQAVSSLVMYHVKCRDVSLSAVQQVVKPASPAWFWSYQHISRGGCTAPVNSAYGPAQKWFMDYAAGLTQGFHERPLLTGPLEFKERMVSAFLMDSTAACMTCLMSAITDINRFFTALHRTIQEGHDNVTLEFKST